MEVQIAKLCGIGKSVENTSHYAQCETCSPWHGSTTSSSPASKHSMHTGQVRPARRDASLSLPLGSFSTKERCVGAGALPPLLGWMHNLGCGAPVVFGSSATAVRLGLTRANEAYQSRKRASR